MKDEPLKTCPKDRCRMKKWGRGAVKRQLGAGAGFIFKGSGFYITDYRSDSYKKGAEADKPKKKEEKKSSKKSEAKPKASPKKKS